jgi:hypothetical protein
MENLRRFPTYFINVCCLGCKWLPIALQKNYFLWIYNKMLQKCVHAWVVSCLYCGHCHVKSIFTHHFQAGMDLRPKKCADYFHNNAKIVSYLPGHGWAKISCSVMFLSCTFSVLWVWCDWSLKKIVMHFLWKLQILHQLVLHFYVLWYVVIMLLYARFPFRGLPFLLKHLNVPVCAIFF